MTNISSLRVQSGVDFERRPGILLVLLSGVLLAIMVPDGIALAMGPWQTEQEGHGPFIIAIALWLAWSKRADLFATDFKPAYVSGWLSLLTGLLLLFVGRSLEILWIDTLSFVPMLGGVVLLTGGWTVFRILAFPIGILFFAVPPPAWLLDALTLPLKLAISDIVTRLLYNFGLPIAQNGVVIMIGPYQLLVKDACAGMNSIFALSAIGLIYLYLMRHTSRLRNLLLFAAILPITILANFMRVVLLVLIAFYLGSDQLEGPLHDLSGIALFMIAFVMMVAFDGLLGLGFRLLGWNNAPAAKIVP